MMVPASDVLIQHIRVAPETPPTAESRQSRFPQDRWLRDEPVRNIVIDHCSFSWSIDEIASTWGPHDNICLPTTSSPNRSTTRCIRNTTARA